MPANSIAVNGFLGDILSGAHASPVDGDHATAPERLMRFNRGVYLGDEADRKAVDTYKSFIHTNEALISELLERSAFTTFDLLDYSFRQSQRIRPVMVGSGRRWKSPHTDPSWIAHWARTPLDRRLDQFDYKTELARSYPFVFSSRKSPSRRIRNISRRLYREFGPDRMVPQQMFDLANPIKNLQFRSLSQRFLSDRLIVVICCRYGLLGKSNVYARIPTRELWTLLITVSSAEAYLAIDVKE